MGRYSIGDWELGTGYPFRIIVGPWSGDGIVPDAEIVDTNCFGASRCSLSTGTHLKIIIGNPTVTWKPGGAYQGRLPLVRDLRSELLLKVPGALAAGAKILYIFGDLVEVNGVWLNPWTRWKL